MEERKYPSSNRSSVAGDDWVFEENDSSFIHSHLSKTMDVVSRMRDTEGKSKEEPTEQLATSEDVLGQKTAATKYEKMKNRFFLKPKKTQHTSLPSERSSVAGEVNLVSALSMSGERMRFLRSPEYIARFYGKDSEQYRRAIEKQGKED